MSKTSCITHPANTPLLIIRADYLILCDGNACAAALLNEFEYGENHAIQQAERDESDWAKPGTEAADPERWFYWTRADIIRRLFNVFGDKQVDAALALLIKRGLIDRRAKGESKLDHRYQYRFLVANAQTAIDALNMKSLDAAILQQRVARMKNRSRKTATLSTSLRESTKTNTNTKDYAADKNPAAPASKPRQPSSRKATAWEPHFTALVTAFGLTPETLAKSAAGLYWKVAHELYDVSFPAERIGELYRYVHEMSLKGEWSQFTVVSLAKYSADFQRDHATTNNSDDVMRTFLGPNGFILDDPIWTPERAVQDAERRVRRLAGMS